MKSTISRRKSLARKRSQQAVDLLADVPVADAPLREKDIWCLKLLLAQIDAYSRYGQMGMKRALKNAIKALERSRA